MNNKNENNINVLSDASLNRVLIIADNLSREAVIRFDYKTPETATIGNFNRLSEIFGKALSIALDAEKIPYNQSTLVACGTLTGLRQNFGINAYDRQRRKGMISQLRETLQMGTTFAPVIAAKTIRKPELIAI